MTVQYKCHCDNGFTYIEENGRQVRDACYHCGNTGWIDEETYFKDRIETLAEIMSVADVDRQRKWANSNPDGEGWAFQAAEHGCHEYEYTQGAYYAATAALMDELKIVYEKCPRLLRALLDHHVPNDREAKYPEEEGLNFER